MAFKLITLAISILAMYTLHFERLSFPPELWSSSAHQLFAVFASEHVVWTGTSFSRFGRKVLPHKVVSSTKASAWRWYVIEAVGLLNPMPLDLCLRALRVKELVWVQ